MPTTVTYASMVPDISAFLPGCPSLVIERTIRKLVIDLCQRGKVWREELAPITLVPGTTTYTLTAPYAYASVVDVLDGHILYADGTKIQLPWVDYDTVRRKFPSWPEDAEGQPQALTSRVLESVALAPTPDTAGDLHLFVTLRPKAAASVWHKELHEIHDRTIFHGVLHELMLMPERAWTDEKSAAYHGKQWSYLCSQSRGRAERGYNIDTLAVEMRPFA